MKIPLQDKIAELERRIVALETQARTVERVTIRTRTVDLEPEMGNIWRSFDALFAKFRL